MEHRLEICSKCDQFYRDSLGFQRCRECTCFLVSKTSLITEPCPLKKW